MRAVVAAGLCLSGALIPAHADPVDSAIGSGDGYLAFREAGTARPSFSLSLSRPGKFTILDAFLGGDHFGTTVISTAGVTVFSGLTSRPTLGQATADPSYALQNPALGAAQGGVSTGGRTATGFLEASPHRAGGAYAALFSFDAGPGGGSSSRSGGAPSPEIDAVLGLALVGGTVAFLRRKRRAPFGPAAG